MVKTSIFILTMLQGIALFPIEKKVYQDELEETVTEKNYVTAAFSEEFTEEERKKAEEVDRMLGLDEITYPQYPQKRRSLELSFDTKIKYLSKQPAFQKALNLDANVKIKDLLRKPAIKNALELFLDTEIEYLLKKPKFQRVLRKYIHVEIKYQLQQPNFQRALGLRLIKKIKLPWMAQCSIDI